MLILHVCFVIQIVLIRFDFTYLIVSTRASLVVSDPLLLGAWTEATEPKPSTRHQGSVGKMPVAAFG